MKRRLFNLAAAASLMLCVATAAMWGRSYWAQDQVTIRPGVSLTTIHLFQSGGSVASTITHTTRYEVAARRAKFASAPRRVDLYAYWATRSPLLRGAGFAIIWSPNAEGNGVLVPHWFLVLAAAGLPALAAHRAWRQRRAQQAGEHPCPTCGYDLRATPNRCPECGTAVEVVALRGHAQWASVPPVGSTQCQQQVNSQGR